MEKKLQPTVEAVKQEHPDAEVELWAEDEHRMGLHPVNRMIWVPLGENPTAAVNWKYQWVWLIGFVHPASGETYWWIVPVLTWQVFERVLVDFARHFQVGTHKRIILVLDNAAFHTTEKLTVPEGIHLLFLPPQSPELQPAERLWPSVNEAIANRSFETIDEMEERVSHRCRVLLKRQEFIRGLTGYHGWLEAAA